MDFGSNFTGTGRVSVKDGYGNNDANQKWVESGTNAQIRTIVAKELVLLRMIY